MSPEYLNELADLADPDQLWRTAGLLGRQDMPDEKRRQMDMGVALRRHAAHVKQLNDLREKGLSLCITPLSINSTASMSIKPPPRHQKLLDRNPS